MTTLTAPNLTTLTTILHKAVGCNYQPGIYDTTGPAKIHYQVTEPVEQGSAHPHWGVTTWERDEAVNKIAHAETVTELTHMLRTLEEDTDGACVQHVELSDEMACELIDMWHSLFGDKAKVTVRHSAWSGLV